MDDLRTAIAKIIAAAWADNNFQEELVAAGDDRVKINAVLKKKGLKLPDIPTAPKAKIRFVANTADSRYVVIPQRPNFTDEDMGVLIKLRQEKCFDCGCIGGATKSMLDSAVKKVYPDE